MAGAVDLKASTDGVNTVEDALAQASNAHSPAETVRWLYAACSLQQQQIVALEVAATHPDSRDVGIRLIVQGVRGRARKALITAGLL